MKKRGQLLLDSNEFVNAEIERAAQRVANELTVASSPEKLFALSQSAVCKPYLASGGIEAALQKLHGESSAGSKQ